MIQPTSTEAIFEALMTLIGATQLNSAPAFVTVSRRLPPQQAMAGVQQPAAFLLESSELVVEKEIGLPVEEFKCALIVLFKIPGDLNTVASTVMNQLRDAVVNQLRQWTLTGGALPAIPMQPGTRQTLGGLCYHCRISGEVLKNEGLLNQQGAIVFPISILSGM
jgi:hypothetical protein